MLQVTERELPATGADAGRMLVVERSFPDPVASLHSLRFTRPNSFYVRHGKRVLDLALAVVLSIIAGPIVLVAGLAVLLTSGWPVFYASERVGKDGKPFRMWKLRTMCRDADEVLKAWLANPSFEASFRRSYKIDRDPRITRLGAFLRRTSIDELPQLLNVLRGEMSLVGPRPLSRPELEHFGSYSDELLSFRPGITGHWQLEGRNRTPYPARIIMELSSVRYSGFANDMRVLLRTLAVPLKLDGR